jgi:hypothetical protein
MILNSKTALLLFAFCLLLSKSSISQTGSVKLIVYLGDTMVAMSIKDLTKANLMENEAVKYRDLSDTLAHHSNKKDIQLFSLETVLSAMGVEKTEWSKLVEDCKGSRSKLQDELNRMIRKYNRAAFWSKVAVAVVAVETVILILITQ